MYAVLMIAGGAGLLAAAAALWVQRQPQTDQRFFAFLVAAAVALSLFALVAWTATLILRVPLALIWPLLATAALFFAWRIYRELRFPPGEPG